MAETEQTNVEIDGPQLGNVEKAGEDFELVDMKVAHEVTNKRIQDAQLSLATEILAAIQKQQIVGAAHLGRALPGHAASWRRRPYSDG